VKRLWSRLDQLRDRGLAQRLIEDVIAPLAGLLFLKWAEHFDSEQEAIAAFDGVDYRPALEVPVRWSSWRDLRGEPLREFLRERLLPGMRSAAGGLLGQSIQRLAHVIDRLAQQEPEIVGLLLEWSLEFDVESSGDRRGPRHTRRVRGDGCPHDCRPIRNSAPHP